MAGLNQLGNTLYPMPSRTLMINEMRSVKADVTKKQDEILDNYLRDHPEYAVNDTTQERGFYHKYMASQKLVKEELEPIVKRYEVQLEKQQNWISKFKWISPAIIVQESMNRVAGTSTEDYDSYRKQVVKFADTWRGHFMPFLYNNQVFKTSDFSSLPSFSYQSSSTNPTVIPTVIVVLVSFGILLLGWLAFQRKTKHGSVVLD